MLGPYRPILARPGATAFSVAGVIARLPMAMVGIGIVLMVSTVYGSYGLAGQIAAAQIVTHAVCAPQLSRLVDRHGQAKIMRPAIVVSALGMGGLIAVGAVAGSWWWLLLFAVVTGASVGSVGALVRARWSAMLTDPREIHTAYSLESALDEVCFVVGPVLATVLATEVHPTAGLVVPLVAALGGGFWLFAQRATEPPTSVRVAGVRGPHVLRSGAVIVVVVVFIALGTIFGANDVAAVAFAEEHGNKGAAGVLLAIMAGGSLLGGLGYGARHWLSPLWKRFAVGMIALGLGVCLFVLVTSMTGLGLAMFVVGFLVAPSLINGNALVQQIVPAEQLTEGLTWVGTALGVGVSLGSSVGGLMIDADGSHGGYLVVVAAGVGAVVAVLATLRTLRRGETTPTLA